MRKFILFLVLSIFVVGCSSNDLDGETNTSEKETSSKEEEKEVETSETKKDEEEANQVDASLDKEVDDLIGNANLAIPTKEIDSPFGEDGNIINQHTEIEIVEEHMNEDGRIYFDLDDQPIRSITNEDGSISNITNYSDTYINITEDVAYVLPKEAESFTYNVFMESPPKELRDLQPEDYRSWEEATNLERGIMQITILTTPILNAIDPLIAQEKYDGEEMKSIQEVFFELGSPNVLTPAPQTVLDYQLFENMQMIKRLWEEVGKFEHTADNHDEFDTLYQELRQEMNNLLVRVNYTLSEDAFN